MNVDGSGVEELVRRKRLVTDAEFVEVTAKRSTVAANGAVTRVGRAGEEVRPFAASGYRAIVLHGAIDIDGVFRRFRHREPD